MSKKINKQEAFSCHSEGRPGKIEVIPTKPTITQKDLGLAYTPGVAFPCLAIEKRPDDAYKYTSKGNLVAVVSNGSAVLGLGNIGALAGKPVMEGKGLLFKIFSDVDVFDIEIDSQDPEEIIKTVKLMAPTFGGINLEDIKSPECFEIEDRLVKELDIPVMHDDQHGTAIISGAALLNALELSGRKIQEAKMVVSGAGAAAISCSRHYIRLGLKKENIVMVDSKGVIRKDRKDLNKFKKEFATDQDLHTLEEAVAGADIFMGLSTGNILSKDMVRSMATDPIIFAMANPDPEITYPDAKEAVDKLIIATGRSDYPNQVNNVLGFPFIFRGALDVRATTINNEMKIAATKALADLAKQPVPDEVNHAYHEKNLSFGRDYIIPKPFDPRLIVEVSSAVAKAAIESGVALKPIENFDKYRDELSRRLGKSSGFMRNIRVRAREHPKKVVFAEADNYKILKAAEIINSEKLAHPILLGNVEKIRALIKENKLKLPNATLIDPRSKLEASRRKEFAQDFYEERQRNGISLPIARDLMRHRNYFGIMLVRSSCADAMVSGLTTPYPDTIRPALQLIGKEKGTRLVSGMYIMLTKRGPVFFADTNVNMNPDVDDLIEITLQAARRVRQYNITPRIALLSYSNFGSHKGRIPTMVKETVEKLQKEHPELIVDGEMQANFAVNNDLLKEHFPFSKLVDGPANVLIFPYLSAGNIAYKLVQEMSQSETIGPVLNGLAKSVHILQMGSTVKQIVDMVAIAVIDAQLKE